MGVLFYNLLFKIDRFYLEVIEHIDLAVAVYIAFYVCTSIFGIQCF